MTRTIALTVTALAFAVAGCGGSDDNSSDTSGSAASTPSETTPAPASGGGASSNLKVDADPSGQLKFDKSSLSAKAGKVTIEMDNPSDVPHGVGIEGNGVDEEGSVVNKGGKSTVSADLKPGSYEFYCPVPGHKEAGMEGKLTVK